MASTIVPSSASRSPFTAGSPFHHRSPAFFFLPAFDNGTRPASKCSAALVSSSETSKAVVAEPEKRLGKRTAKPRKKANATATVNASPAPEDLDYNKMAEALESIYQLSPGVEVSNSEDGEDEVGRVGVVRSWRRGKRLDLGKRVAMKSKGGSEKRRRLLDEYEEKLVREYSVLTNLGSLEWKRMKIPPVLSSAEHRRLFKLMQPMKAILEVKENLEKDLKREPTDAELAAVMNLSVPQLRRHIEVGQAARNKLIKHNLRLVLFVMNKYYSDFANRNNFEDLCQAGVKGLITAIDRFEPKRGFRLSTYGLFWIRHCITRFMTVSSFTSIPFGFETERQEIQKAKFQLSFELGRSPTDHEIIDRVRMSPERYHDIIRASRPVLSLNARHKVTQEELLYGITDEEGVGGDRRKQPTLLRLALDDVLDSLKPKESLVIRQRFGMDGKGERTLGEIAGNLNISREMVRKHELKALMKLKHPTRVDYLRRYL